VFAIRDINPQAPKHVLVIPKKVIPRLAMAGRKTRRCSGISCSKPPKLPANWVETKAATGWSSTTARMAVRACRTVHVHILGGRRMAWPPG